MLTVIREEGGAAMVQGYAKVAGKPKDLPLHGTVGVRHGPMPLEGLVTVQCGAESAHTPPYAAKGRPMPTLAASMLTRRPAKAR